MFCPNCGQQQATDQMRFCSRCGFPLGLVSEILVNGGFLPQLAAIHSKKKLFTRRKVFIFGLIWFLVFTFLIIPILAVLFGDTAAGDRIIPFAGVIGTMGGLLLMLFSLFFESEKKKAATPLPPVNFAMPNQVAAPQSQNALPPQAANFTPTNNAYQPPRGGWREAKTGELIPPSITEGTTRLLEKDEG